MENSSQFVREQNLLAISGSTWKEPGNIEECHKEQLYETHFCVYCRDVVKDVVDDIPQCFLYEDLLKKFSLPSGLLLTTFLLSNWIVYIL